MPWTGRSHDERAGIRQRGPIVAQPTGMTTLIILLLVLFAIGSLPAWPYSRAWGYYPSSGLGLLVLVMLLLLFTGRI